MFAIKHCCETRENPQRRIGGVLLKIPVVLETQGSIPDFQIYSYYSTTASLCERARSKKSSWRFQSLQNVFS